MVVIGAGAVGLELGSVWRRLGAEVTLIEMLPTITPFADKQMAKTLQRALAGQGLEFRLSSKVTAGKVLKKSVKLTVEDDKGESEEVSCDKVLVAVGRRPYSDGAGLDSVGVEVDAQGRVVVDDDLRTNVDGIWAIGDLVRGPMLAHKAEDEGMAVAESIAGGAGHVNYDAIPNVVYTEPELAMVGRTDAELKEAGIAFNTGRFQFRANGRAKSLGQQDGMVKILADKETDRVLGVHMVGPRVSELIAEAVVTMEYGGSAEDLARSCHAHPTLSEVVREAETRYRQAQQAMAEAREKISMVEASGIPVGDNPRQVVNIFSPMNGVIINRPVELGETVTGSGSFNAGTVISTVADLPKLLGSND
jgi:dihydrolipoamide dehydrogenase